MLSKVYNFEFGEFLLDTQEKVLLRDGKPLPITPKAFQLLFVLLEKHGHLVEKDDLMKSVWADSFVEEGNITFTIGLLRKLLEDDTKNPRFIETVPRRGYRFIADVRRVEAEEASRVKESEAEKNSLPTDSANRFSLISTSARLPSHKGTVVTLADWRREAGENETRKQISPSTTAQELPIEQTVKLQSVPTKPKSKHLFNYRLAAFALTAILISAGALGYYFYGSKNAPNANGKKSIAVLPVKPINAGVRDELYEIGIADSLIHRLSSMKGFIVRPLSATRKYADIEQDAITAGKEQQVDYVLVSNYQLADGKIRITAQFINVANGQIEETYKSERDFSSIFAMQDAIADEFGSRLQARFATVSSSPAAKRGTTNEEAYRLYLQGMYLYGNKNPADSQKAVKVFEQAVALDPNYAAAWAGKAHAHRMIANLGRSVNIHEENQKSTEAVNKALMLDADSADAHSALCENKMYYDYDFAEAERECLRAIELDPNSARAHEVYSRYLSGRGRHTEAIAEVKTAIDLEPASLFNQLLYANSLHFARRYEEAVAQYKRVITMDENSPLTYPLGSITLELQGNGSEAFQWWMKYQTLSKADEETVQDYQKAYQTSGWQGVQRERVKKFEASNLVYFHGAAFNAQIGNTDKAFEYLEKSYQRREYWMSYLLVDPRLDSLRTDPRFDELVTRIGLK